VIRWAFEKQGLFQPPGAAMPVTEPGVPPEVDVYIDDGRGGEYPYQAVHWNNLSIWNRNTADGLPDHQPAIVGAPNFAYVTLKNRGTQDAANVIVKGFHSLPGAGLTWPNDFTPMTPAAGMAAAAVPANSATEVTLGPFEWTPNTNAFGHDCLLMIASVAGDVSNVDNLLPGETIADWRLVPHDNNIGQRNVQLIPAAEGTESIMTGLQERIFIAGNALPRRATMRLQARLPEVLSAAGWSLDFSELEGDEFVLDAGEKRQVTIALTAGDAVSADQITAADDRDIIVTLVGDDVLLGGMTYQLDPSLA